MFEKELEADLLEVFLQEQKTIEVIHNIEEETVPRNICLSSHFLGDVVSETRRSKVLDWMVEVVEVYKWSDTMWMASAMYFDLLLKKVEISNLRDLQNLALTCLWISNKYEDNLRINTSQFCELSDNGFSKQELLNQEQLILSTIDFKLKVSNSLDYIRLIGSLGNCSTEEGLIIFFFQ